MILLISAGGMPSIFLDFPFFSSSNAEDVISAVGMLSIFLDFPFFGSSNAEYVS